MTAAFEDPVWDLGLPTEAEALLSDPPASRLERLRRFDPQARTYWIEREPPGPDPATMERQW